MGTPLFQKNLSDLIKGIRSNKKNEGQFISKMLTEIKAELKSKEIEVKAVAIQKLTFVCSVIISSVVTYCSYK